VTRRPDGRGYLGLLTVEPTLQAAGLGRRLIAAAEDCARAFGAKAMEMTVIASRGELIAYYERRGYALTGERRPFPLDDPRFGLPKTRDLEFVVLEKAF
jgi:GNAT superfamily N-acetyltransferase